MSLNLTVLRLFFRELPDPGIQLFYQDNPTTRFHRFNKLSTELRLIIWNLIRGRKIIVRVDVYCCLRSNTTVPVTFSINQESRRETMRHYRQPYELDQYPAAEPQRALHRHWFDPEVDTVCFPDAFGFLNYSLNKGDRRQAFRGDDLAIIQSVEFGHSEWEHFLGGGRWQGIIATRFFATGFESFSDLRELILIRGGKGLRTPDEVHSCLSVLNAIYVLGSLNVPEVTVRSEKGTEWR